MANRTFGRAMKAAPLALLLLAGAPPAAPQAAPGRPRAGENEAAAPSRRSDAQVVGDLTAKSRKRASRAVQEVMRRGGRMVPHLLKLKGDRRCFYGDMLLGSHAGCSYRLMPLDDTGCFESSSASTVEVAALFLLEAVYRDDLKFAQGATLIERDTDGQQRTDVKYNGREVIARAWSEAGRWFAEFEREGLAALRARGRGPFAGTRLDFY